MTAGVATAALALMAAVLVAPPPYPRARARWPRRRGPRLPLRWVPTAAAGAAVLVLPPGVAVAAGLLTGTAWLRLRHRRADRRRRAEAAALQDALEVLVGELAVGAHPVTAVEAAAAETTGAVAEALRTVAARARLGADVPAGLRAAAADSALAGAWERLAVCWQLAETHGLAIATLLGTAQRDIVERERFLARVHAGLAGARTTAVVLAGLPLAGIAIGQAIGADPVAFLCGGGPGGVVLAVGVALGCAGLLWSDRITAGALR